MDGYAYLWAFLDVFFLVILWLGYRQDFWASLAVASAVSGAVTLVILVIAKPLVWLGNIAWDELSGNNAQRAREQLARERQERDRIEEERVSMEHARAQAEEEKRHRQTTNPTSPLWLKELTLIIQSGNKRSVSAVVNPKKVTNIRPVTIIEVNSDKFANKRLQLIFQLINPHGIVQFEYVTEPVLKKGPNKIAAQRTYPISNQTQQGKWRLRLWAYDHSWGERIFTLSVIAPGLIEGQIGADMEITMEALKLAEEFTGVYSVDELLNS